MGRVGGGAHPDIDLVRALRIAEDVEGLSHSHLVGVGGHAEGGGGGAGCAGGLGLGGAAAAVAGAALVALITLVAVVVVVACTQSSSSITYWYTCPSGNCCLMLNSSMGIMQGRVHKAQHYAADIACM